MQIPDDAKLKEELRKILAVADLEQFTKRDARRQLEKALGLAEGGLDERKKDIADWVEEYIQEKDNEQQEQREDDEEESGSESEEEKPAAKPEKKGKGGKGWKAQWLKPALAEFVGSSQMKRTEVVKMIWDHVKSNNLQDPSNKQFFICDEKLFKVFNKKRIHCFKMNKDLSKLMHPAEEASAPARKRKASSDDEGDDDDGDDGASDGSSSPAPKRKAAAAAPAKKRKASKGGGGFQAEVQLSDELSSLLGSDRMPRTQVVKGLWVYIKENNLQDPKNKMRIIPDARMRTVFGKEPFTGFSMMKLLSKHISKA